MYPIKANYLLMFDFIIKVCVWLNRHERHGLAAAEEADQHQEPVTDGAQVPEERQARRATGLPFFLASLMCHK